MTRTIIRRFDPWSEFRVVQNELQRMVNNSLSLFPSVRGTDAFAPPLDVVQTDNAIIVRADLPGCRREDLQLSIENQVLTLSGSKTRTSEENSESQAKHERVFGSFQRSVPLPVAVDSEKANASYTDGVLTVTLPTVPEARPRTIAIATNGETSPSPSEN